MIASSPDACHSRGERDSAVVGRPGHAHLAGGPRGGDLFASVDRAEALRAAVEPIDHGLRCELFGIRSNGDAALVTGRSPARRNGRRRSRAAPMCSTSELDTFSRFGRNAIGGCDVRGGGSVAEFLLDVPEELPVAGRSGEIRRRLVNDRDLQPLSLGLTLPRDIHEHAIAPAVPVGVELGLDPQRLPDPSRAVLERGHDLRLAVDEDRLGAVRRGRALLRSRAAGSRARRSKGSPAQRCARHVNALRLS